MIILRFGFITFYFKYLSRVLLLFGLEIMLRMLQVTQIRLCRVIVTILGNIFTRVSNWYDEKRVFQTCL